MMSIYMINIKMKEITRDLNSFNRTKSVFVEMIDELGEPVIIQQIYLIVGFDYIENSYIAEYLGDGIDIILN